MGCFRHLCPDRTQNSELLRQDDDRIGGMAYTPLVLPTEPRALLMRKLMPLMPGKDARDVDEHISWHIQLSSLQAQKKALLASWREERQYQRDESKSKASSGGSTSGDSMGIGLVEEAGEFVDSGDIGVVARGGGEATMSGEDRAAVRERIAKWKQEKEEREIQEQLRQQEKAAQQQKEQEEKVRVR